MLSGEGNENGEKTTIGLNSKEATLHVQQTFFVHFFAVVLHDYKVKSSRNFLVTRFMEEMSYVLFCSLFVSLPLFFTLPHFLTAATKFPKNVFLFFISRSSSLSLFFSLSFAGLSPTFSFLCLSLSLYSKFVDVTINLSLIL